MPAVLTELMRRNTDLTVESEGEDHEEEEESPQRLSRQLGDAVRVGNEGQSRTCCP